MLCLCAFEHQRNHLNITPSLPPPKLAVYIFNVQSVYIIFIKDENIHRIIYIYNYNMTDNIQCTMVKSFDFNL